jgi:hypothetical protein
VSQITWIASYPRSGNTWTRFMLTSYLMDTQITTPDAIENLIPDFHHLVRKGGLNWLTENDGPMPGGDSAPRLVKTHYRPSAEIMQQCGFMTEKVIYIVRNPRDVLLSAARFQGIIPSQGERSRRWAEDFIVNKGDFIWPDLTGTWPQNVHEWTTLTSVRQYFPAIEVLALRYEDMRADPIGKLYQIVEFLDLGTEVDSERVRRAVENSTIEIMRAFEERTRAAQDASGSDSGQRRETRYINQGLRGQSLVAFGDDIEATFQLLMEEDKEFSPCARRFGYIK